MFSAALSSFSAIYRLPSTPAIEPPIPFDHPESGLVLALHMAALVAVDAHVHGRRPPCDMAGLTVYLLDREHLHWVRLQDDAAHEISPGERRYLTPAAIMNKVVFTAALTGPLDRITATSALSRVGVRGNPDQVLADHATSYPPAVPSMTSLEPLYPDRLAEDFLALTLPGHDTADYPSKDWAARQARKTSAPSTCPQAGEEPVAQFRVKRSR
jgi:hypothetical protein